MGKNPSITVYALALLAADRADMLKDDGTGNLVLTDFANLTAVLAYANFELAALWDALINSNEDYCVYRQLVEVVAGQENYPLPEDFYKFRKVFPLQNGRRWNALRKFDLSRLGQADSLSAILTSPIEETQYSIRGMRLWLHPKPTNAAQLEMWYIPQFRYLENADDLIPAQFPNGWEEYVIEGIAARLLEKEESDASAHRARQEKILQRILIMVEDRDVGEPHKMQDTEGLLLSTYSRRGSRNGY